MKSHFSWSASHMSSVRWPRVIPYCTMPVEDISVVTVLSWTALLWILDLFPLRALDKSDPDFFRGSHFFYKSFFSFFFFFIFFKFYFIFKLYIIVLVLPNIKMKVSFLKCIYLFVAALCPPCCVRAFSGYVEQELLLCCRAQALGCAAFIRPSCPVACGILLLDQGSNPCPLHWQADCYPLDHQGSPLVAHILKDACIPSVMSDSLQPYGL